jgi:threonine dehydrogenase-like Zn-dependent dehydrogenase
MRQIWYAAKDKLEVRQVPVPGPGYGQVKIKMHYAAICATDVHQMTMGIMGVTPPTPMGHEGAGIITELGPGTEASYLKVGDKVTFCPATVCGMCPNCKDKKDVRCTGAGPVFAFADYVITSANATFKIPDDEDLKSYALTEPLAGVLRALELSNVKHGQTVLISGAGGIGSIMVNANVLSGAAQLTVSEPVAAKRERALAMGAQYVIDPVREDFKARVMEITGGKGFDYIFEMSGVPSVAPLCLDIAAYSGTIIYFAVYPPSYQMPVNLYELYRRELCIKTVIGGLWLFPRAVNLIPRLQMDKIIGTILPLDKIEEAFDLFHKSIYPKILLDCT